MSLNYFSQKRISTICLALVLILFNSLSLSAEARPSQGLPGRRVGGGSRGCQEAKSSTALDPKQLIALVPESNVSKTATDYPTLFFRVPNFPSSKSLELVLRDDRDQKVYKTTFQSPNSGGILAVPLPGSAMPPLAVGKSYHWYFSIICDARDRAKDIALEGNIQRVQLTPALAGRLRQASFSERANLFLTNGLWQDALMTMFLQRRDRPQDPAVAVKWAELLKSIGLDTIAKDSILEQPQSSKPAQSKL